MPYAEEMSDNGSGAVIFATITECQQGATVDKAVRPHGLLFIRPASPGTAHVGGILAGNTRGAGAMDVQSVQTSVSMVASGSNSSCLGNDNTASAANTTAVGSQNTASSSHAVALGYLNSVSNSDSVGLGSTNTVSGQKSIAIGFTCTATQLDSIAIGDLADATAAKANAIGYDAAARIANTTNLSSAIIIKKDNGEITGTTTEAMIHGAGAEVIIMSQMVDLMSGGAFARFTPGTNAQFWLNEVGTVVAQLTGSVTTTPFLSYGIDGTTTKYLGSTDHTHLTALKKRDSFNPSTGMTACVDAEANYRADVVTAATGPSAFKGRVYWKGMLVEA
jgi:hypothetical protein